MIMAYMCVTLLIRGTVSQWCPLANLRNSMIMALHVYQIANPKNCITVVPSCYSEEQYDHGIHVCHIGNLRNCMIMAYMCVTLLI